MKKNDLRSRMIREMELRNYSQRTIENYLHALTKLAKFYRLSPDKISSEQVKDYLHNRLIHEGISTSSINQIISGYKILQQDVLKRDWQQIKIKRPRRKKSLPVILTSDEITSMITHTRNLKHKTIISLAYSSGLRKGELQMLKPADIDSGRQQIRVRNGKGQKDRYTLLSLKMLEKLRAYYKTHRPKEYLFESSYKPGTPLALTTLHRIVKLAAERAEIKKCVSFHTLRHCFATHMLENGVNLRIIQQLMGHTSLKTTAIYLHVANIDPHKVTSPFDDLNL